jgi:hypothetical protein
VLLLAKKLKMAMKTLRDSSFNWVEIKILQYLDCLPKFYLNEQRFITFTHRAGRGLKESQADSEFFGTIPNVYKKKFKHLHYNSKFWILDFFKVIFYLLSNRRLKIILIQYVPVFLKFPSIYFLNAMHDRGVEIIKIWPDSWHRDLWEKRILPVSNIGQLNILCDIPNNPLMELDKDHNYSWNPAPIMQFPYIEFTERENFIFYSGGVSHDGIYQSRREYLEYLNANRFLVSGVSYDRDNPISRPLYKDYRKALANSKIGLNFTWKGEVDIITGRTWEIFSSGSLLLQNSSNILDGLFVEGVHYIAFTSKKDLLDRLKFISENLTFAETVANSGHLRFKELLDPQKFWTNLVK